MKENFNFLRKPEILILGFSSIVSGIGNWITMMAILSLVIFQGDGGVAESSGIFMAGLLPIMLASPFAGKLADKYDRRRLMMISEFGAGASIAIIIFTEKLWLIYLAMALQALFVALMNPARQSSLPQLVQEAGELERVNAFFQQLNSVLKIVAPMVAGFLLTIMNAHQAIILDIVSFAISVVILSRLPRLLPVDIRSSSLSRWGEDAINDGEVLPQPGPLDDTRGPEQGELPPLDKLGVNSLDPSTSSGQAPSTGSGQAELGTSSTERPKVGELPRPGLLDDTRRPKHTRGPEGNEVLAYLSRSGPLRLLFLSSFFTILIIVSYDILGSVYIRDVLHGDESFLGLIIGIIGIGSFVTSLLIVMRKSKGNYWRDIAWGNFLLAMLPLCMVLGYFIDDPDLIPVLIIGGSFLGGLGNGFLIIQIMTLLQITSPAHMLGRLSGYLEFTMIGGQMLSVILLPLLIPAVIETYVYFSGATIALWVLAGLVTIQSRKMSKINVMDGMHSKTVVEPVK